MDVGAAPRGDLLPPTVGPGFAASAAPTNLGTRFSLNLRAVTRRVVMRFSVPAPSAARRVGLWDSHAAYGEITGVGPGGHPAAAAAYR